jgi:hypothetical protein
MTVTFEGEGSFEVTCPGLVAQTCTFTGPQGSVGVNANPKAYPAALVVTVTNTGGGPSLVIRIPVYPPAPTPGPGVPTSVPGETPFAFAGTLAVRLSPGGIVNLSCAAPGANTCSFDTMAASPTMSATPTSYPAQLEVTLTNAGGGEATTVVLTLTAPVPQIGGPVSVNGASTFALDIDTGTAAGGTVTASTTLPLTVTFLSGCTPADPGCLIAQRLATVRANLRPAPGLSATQLGAGLLAPTSSAEPTWSNGSTGVVVFTVVNAVGVFRSFEIEVREHGQP